MQAGHDLVVAVAKADKATRPVEPAQRREWLKLAAQAIGFGGDVPLAYQYAG